MKLDILLVLMAMSQWEDKACKIKLKSRCKIELKVTDLQICNFYCLNNLPLVCRD